MREIKFRAWDIPNKKMLFPIIQELATRDHKKFIIQKAPFAPSPVVKLMQFTGLKDKNKREIYEGDIVKGVIDGKDYIGICKYSNRYASFVFDESKTSLSGKTNVTTSRLNKKEVIGNIYEHPHLLATT